MMRSRCDRSKIVFGLLVIILFNYPARGINLRISIKEEQPQGTLVASLSVQFQVSKIRHKNPFVELSYKLLEETSAREVAGLASSGAVVDKSWVHLDTRTGDLTLNRKIDREIECSNKQSLCEQKLQVVLLPQTAFKLAVITLKLEDINDNSPKFTHNKIILPLSESTNLGSKVNLDKYLAKDADIGDNADIKYSLSDESFFGLEQYHDNSDVPHLRLIVRKKLDFMENPVHSYTLTAKDNGSPARSTDISILVNVLDENDHDPVFNKTLYSVNLPENQSPDHVICKVHATDADSGDLGRVTYHLVNSDTSSELTNPGNLISLGPISGEVTLRQKLDRELHDGMKIVIEARDSGIGRQQRTARTVLQIHVTDVNDNAPVINVGYFVEHGEGVAYVPENTNINSYIALVEATDEDSGTNGDCTIKLRPYTGKGGSEKDANNFILNEEGFLQTMAKFDSEKKNDYKINISACDKGMEPLCSSLIITVIIVDENEFQPQFTNPFQRITLPENSQVGSYVATCKAHDGDFAKHKTYMLKKDGTIDTSNNGNIYYRMSSVGAKGFASDNTQAPFAFDPLTGKISLSRPLDYEQAQKWKITVVAKDGGSPRREGHCVVTVMLNDVNDNRPVFTVPAVENSTLYVGLDKRHHKPIVVLKAIDFDQDIASGISYNLLATHLLEDGKYRPIDSSIFNLTNKGGKLFAKDLSEKHIGEYFLKIRALDNGNITLYRDVGLKVDIRAKIPPKSFVISRADPHTTRDTDEASFTILAVALGVGIGAVILLILVVALLVVYIKKKNVSKDPQEDPSIQANRTPSLRNYSTTSSDKQSSRHDAMLSSLTSSPTSTMGKRNIFNNNMKNASCTKTSHSDEPCYVCDLKSSSTSIGQHSPYHKLVENMIMDGKNSLPKPTSPSDHDSGKGSSDTKEDEEEYNKRFFPNKLDIDSTQPLGPKCSQSCREFGHSDTCWMPSHSFYGTQPPTLKAAKGRLGSACSSETTNTTSSSSGPQYYQINNRSNQHGKIKPGMPTCAETDFSDVSKAYGSPQRHHSDSGFKRSSFASNKVPRSPSRAGGVITSPLRRHSDLSAPNKTRTRPAALQLPHLPYKSENHYFSNNYSERSPTKVTFVDDNLPSPVKHSFTKVAAV